MPNKPSFAQTIMDRTYSHYLEDENRLETWEEIATRVTKNVMKSVGVNMRQKLAQDIQRFIAEKKLIPGGRYLYASGNTRHQINNCLALKVYDSREGWSELLSKASMGLMTGAGIGVDYSDIRCEGSPIRKTGGVATGPISLMQIVNECGRGIIQGGNRRSALWAGLRWNHPDIHKFIRIKNWPSEIQSLKAKDYSFPAVLDMTNISVQLDDDFFEAYQDDEHSQHALAHGVYWACIEQMLKTGEPGFSIDAGKNAGETLRNAPVSADTHVLTDAGYTKVKDIIGIPVTLWTGKQWAKNVIFECTGINVQTLKVKMSNDREINADPSHEFVVQLGLGLTIKIPARDLKIGQVLKSDDNVTVLSVEPDRIEDVYCCNVNCPEHTFVAEGVVISNCGELSAKESDEPCNLASINLSKVESLEELKQIVDVATALLLAGSVYSDVPYSDVDKMRTKNRRLGLGLMGVHEWLLMRGKPYGPDEELGQWLSHYAKSGKYANKWADEWGLSRPKKTRAVAPTGTTSIVAETTGGIEPIFCVSYKRRYLKGDQQCYQYVVDPCAKRLIEGGIKPELIEDAYTLAQDVEKRVAFQAWVQNYVDHCISSTINLPAYGSELNNSNLIRPFGSMLMRYLPQLRGITCYPDGSRSGQPLSPVPYEEATKHEGVEMVEESMNICSLRGGSCGD